MSFIQIHASVYKASLKPSGVRHSSTLVLPGFKIHILEPELPHGPDEKTLIVPGQVLRQPCLGRVSGPRPGVLELVRRLLIHIQEHMRDIPHVDDVIENATDTLPPFVEDFSAVRVTVNPILQHLADGGCGHVQSKECDPGRPRKTIEQAPGSCLGLVSLVEAGFEFDSDRDHHTCQLPDIEWERCVPVSLKGTEFVGDGRSDQTLRELTILGVGGESVEPGRSVIREPDGSFNGEGDGEVGDVESWATAEVKDLHGIETVQRPQ